MRKIVIMSSAEKCTKCGAKTITPRSSYCSQHFDELLKQKARES